MVISAMPTNPRTGPELFPRWFRWKFLNAESSLQPANVQCAILGEKKTKAIQLRSNALGTTTISEAKNYESSDACLSLSYETSLSVPLGPIFLKKPIFWITLSEKRKKWVK